MAYSPSPQPGAPSTFLNPPRSSMTPPLPRVISKRDKRMNGLSERYNALGANFALNRDVHYRSQMQSLQLAMNHINSAGTYNNQPLNDNPDDIFEDLKVAVTDNAQRVAQSGARSNMNMHEVPVGTEMLIAAFVREVNDAMETRDANLATVANKYNDAIATMQRDAGYQVDIALIEREHLATTMRDRIYHTVSKRRARLLADRDTLDLADTNPVPFHSNPTSVPNPTSPAGPQSHRKTRHTRHRLEVDEMGSLEINRKKRKGLNDIENGSPSRAVESDSNFHWREANMKDDAQPLAPALTLERLFTEKDLILTLQKASRLAVQNMSKRRKLNPVLPTKLSRSKASSKGKATQAQALASSSSPSVDEAEPSYFTALLDANAIANVEGVLEAPVMDRTANSSYHATRSTGVISNSTTTFAEDLALPGDIVGRRSAIDYLGTQREPRKREDDYQRAPPLTEPEKEADRQAMKRAIEEFAKGKETKRAKTLMSNSSREVVDHIQAAEELIQESSLRETLGGTNPGD